MATGAGLGGQLPVVSGITGTTRAATGGAYSQYVEPVGYFGTSAMDNTGAGYGASITTGSTMMGPAIQTIWSKEILFQSMPVLRFEQFAVKKTELGTMPGLSVNFMRYNNLPVPAGPLTEGVRMKTHAITANQYAITVAEQGFAVAVSELLLNASFDDIMASSSRLLGRNMALYMDSQARDTLARASSVVFGYQKPGAINTGYGVYEPGTPATSMAQIAAGPDFYLTPHAVKDAVEVLSAKNIPRLGETYVCFIHPHQSRRLRDTPEWIEVTKYAAPGNFMLGEIGRLNDVVFIETTQITQPYSTVALETDKYLSLPGGAHATASPPSPDWRGNNLGLNEAQRAALVAGTFAGGAGAPQAMTGLTNYDETLDAFPGIDQNPTDASAPSETSTVVDVMPQYGRATPGWGEPWGPYGPTVSTFEAIMLGDNAFGHAISLPVELRDGGVLDFGREHALAWYSIWGWGVVTDSSVVKILTN